MFEEFKSLSFFEKCIGQFKNVPVPKAPPAPEPETEEQRTQKSLKKEEVLRVLDEIAERQRECSRQCELEMQKKNLEKRPVAKKGRLKEYHNSSGPKQPFAKTATQ